MIDLEQTMKPTIYGVEKFLLLDIFDCLEASLEYMQEELTDHNSSCRGSQRLRDAVRLKIEGDMRVAANSADKLKKSFPTLFG